MGKIPLIYILSTGRSGSTLLDLLLGVQPEIWTMGEAQILPWEVRVNRTPCGCGQPVADCDFWHAALPQIPIGEGQYPIEYFRESHTAGKVIRWEHLRDIRRGWPSRRRQEGVAQYAEVNAQYFRAVQQEAEKRRGRPIKWLVDASKDPYRLFWFLHSDEFDIRVIHLIKDPRAFVYSMNKTSLSNNRHTLRFAGRWWIQNRLFASVCRSAAPKAVMALRYEALAADYRTVLHNLGAWLDIQVAEPDETTIRSVENHAISGNPMRWRNDEIHLDDAWQTNLPVAQARMTWAIVDSLAKTYGYK